MSSLYLREDEVDPTLFLDAWRFNSRSRSAVLPAGLTLPGLVTPPRSLSLTKGTVATSITRPGLATTSHQDYPMGIFVSPPLDDQTIPADTWNLYLSLKESGIGTANSYVGLVIYLYRIVADRGPVVFFIDSDGPLGNEWATTTQACRIISFDGPSTSVQRGDRLVMEVWRHAIQDTSATPDQILYFGGGTDILTEGDTSADPASMISVPGTTLLPAAPATETLSGGSRIFGKRTIEERWYICGRCGRHYPESQTVILAIPHANPGLRVCIQYCLDDYDHDMYRYGWTPPTEKEVV